MKLTINGKVLDRDLPEDMPLLWALRDEFDLPGTKFGCGVAQCGACTVHVDGAPVRACITPIGSLDGAKITTIEAIAQTPQGKALQKAWLEIDVMQCGYCQAGQIMSAAALLKDTPKPTDADIDAAMDGNLCRCATYQRIRAAIKSAAGMAVADTREV
ncbi:(2Fe-2S)-binding protein [Asticcacaulis sp. BYS171W]|uniref:(2Fe-2S)-binding protein n=1 Tax=Asticcacaulis aquaticus TaxID=2984212 RepID=A0ABT5HXR8_9CAUL|nr:(2Fe-2S)-binding protein [Asticcacaulis aquaticus]MDC7684872.1 (2Fe-2S)-binding protein [Asticcacaulis aquaticus]